MLDIAKLPYISVFLQMSLKMFFICCIMLKNVTIVYTVYSTGCTVFCSVCTNFEWLFLPKFSWISIIVRIITISLLQPFRKFVNWIENCAYFELHTFVSIYEINTMHKLSLLLIYVFHFTWLSFVVECMYVWSITNNLLNYVLWIFNV